MLGSAPSTVGDGNRSNAVSVSIVVASIGVVSSLHYVTSSSRTDLHELYSYLCYVPIILAAYWYGVWGGLGAAVLASAAFVPHYRAAWAISSTHTLSQSGQIAVFHLMGLMIGWLANAQRHSIARYRGTLLSLERANRDLQESQEHLRRADRLAALGEIAAGLAHEIQNPLAGVKGAFEIVASRATPGSPEAEFAAIGGKEIARVDTLIREFLTYARPPKPTLRPTAVRDLVDRVVTLLQPEAEKRQISLVSDHPETTATLVMDPDHMTQVILNVALNGIQASPSGSPVRIRESTDGSWTQIDVIDQGPGIPGEHRSRIFEPFFSTKPRGTGLGLAISQRIVASHRGTLTVAEAATGGTIVRIRLPHTAAASNLDGPALNDPTGS